MQNPFKVLFSKNAEENCVPNNRLFSYAAGLAGQNMTYGYISNWLRYFCINILHVDQLKVGSVFFISYFWDAINDPVIGAIVDRRRFKSGEKLRPYLVLTPPIIGILSVFLFAGFGFTENIAILYIVLIYFTWDFFYSFQDVALWGMVAAVSPLSGERARVAKWVGIGAGAGSALAGTFQMVRSMLLGTGMSEKSVFLVLAFVLGLGGELISMSAHRVEEKVKSEAPKESLWQTLSVLRHNKTLLLISLARLLGNISPKVQNAYFFENKTGYNIGGKFIDGKQVEFIFGLVTGIPATFSAFAALTIAKKAGGMKRLLILAQLVSVGFRIVAFFVGYQSLPQLVIVAVLMCIVSVPTSIMDVAHRSLTSDSIDYVEWKTGVRSEGISFAMQNFVSKMNTGVTSLIEGVLLKLLGHNNKGGVQTARFLKWQWPMYILGPAVGALLYICAIIFIKDDPEQKILIENDLRRRRASKLEAELVATE